MTLDDMETGYTENKRAYKYFKEKPSERFPARLKAFPRLLLLVDEFTVLYNEVDQKYVRIIEKEIKATATKGRSAGCHMWFTTQNFSGTIDKAVMEQFKMRLALFLSSSTSETLLGSPIASTISSKGWMYANLNGTENVNAIKLFKVPFCPQPWINGDNGYIQNYVYRKRDENPEIIDRKALYYSDSTIHKIKELDEFFERNPEMEESKYSDLLFLGPSAVYTEQDAPMYIALRSEIGENVMVQAKTMQDRMNLMYTLLNNITRRDVNHIVISGDKDTPVEFTDYKSTFKDQGVIVMKDGESLLDFLELYVGMIEEAEVTKSTYIILENIDKIRDFGVELDSRAKSRNEGRFEALLTRCGENRIHFIVITMNAAQTYVMSWKSKFKHSIATKCEEKDARKLSMDNSELIRALMEGFAYYVTEMEDTPRRFKVYESKLTRVEEKTPEFRG